MFDWRFFRDREGNTYFIDQKGQIRTTGKPVHRYRPVSANGIDYYLNHGIELVNNHYPIEGLVILKSIMALPEKNNRIDDARIKASRWINMLKKREGPRFIRLDRKAAITLFRKRDLIVMNNDIMFYSLQSGFNLKVLKNRQRSGLKFIYHGVLLGFNIGRQVDKKPGKGYDFLMAIDSEKYSVDAGSVDLIEMNWKLKLGRDTLERQVYSQSDNHIIYKFSSNKKTGYSGYEGIYYNNVFGYIVRIVAPRSKFKNLEKIMLETLKSFKIVSSELVPFE